MSKKTSDNPRVCFHMSCSPLIRPRVFECVLNVWACIYLQDIFEITGFGVNFWPWKAKGASVGQNVTDRQLYITCSFIPIKQVQCVFFVDDLCYFCFGSLGLFGSNVGFGGSCVASIQVWVLALKRLAFVWSYSGGKTRQSRLVRQYFRHPSWTFRRRELHWSLIDLTFFFPVHFSDCHGVKVSTSGEKKSCKKKKKKSVNKGLYLQSSAWLSVCSIPYLNSTTACSPLSDSFPLWRQRARGGSKT